jgi:hypothetical protein
MRIVIRFAADFQPNRSGPEFERDLGASESATTGTNWRGQFVKYQFTQPIEPNALLAKVLRLLPLG